MAPHQTDAITWRKVWLSSGEVREKLALGGLDGTNDSDQQALFGAEVVDEHAVAGADGGGELAQAEVGEAVGEDVVHGLLEEALFWIGGLHVVFRKCTMWYIMQTHFAAERLLDAPADVLYRCLADYVHCHRPGPEGFLPPAFSQQDILSGGVGEGTVIRLRVSLGGRTNTMTARITEPAPGRELVETSDAVTTVFTVTPREGGALVRFDTTLRANGLEGLMNRLLAGRLLAPVYEDELTRLERYAQAQMAVAA